jgi:hypothetical protein
VWSNSRSGWGMHGDDQDSGQNKKPWSIFLQAHTQLCASHFVLALRNSTWKLCTLWCDVPFLSCLCLSTPIPLKGWVVLFLLGALHFNSLM